MKLLIPLILGLVGVGAGVGAGIALRPDSAAAEAHGDAEAQHAADEADGHGEAAAPAKPASHGAASGHAAPAGDHGGGGGGVEYVSMGDQFIVPILEASRVRSLVVLSVDIEVAPGQTGVVYRVQPRIRDALLTVLFDHANAGGFNGTFTSSGSMEILRRALREAAGKAAGGDVVADVLITGIVRQDV